MRLELYQAECERIARQNKGILDEVAARIRAGSALSLLEQSGVLHAFQVLVENAIGNLVLNKKHHFIADFLERPITAIPDADGGV
ncbi:MAG: hypothetical protein GX576_15575 [Thauera phenolivorans]|uniref:Uncharacterized protein n=1 Tax=Thauera phenolivorans TaxID=1792543 RepID=A0A7X7LYN5_9RHOO|nr:hypothetical protein [Thauera phenolivorans]